MKLLPLLALASLLTAPLVATEKLNVVFILADDLGWGELGCYGQKKIPTPNIDRLAAQGMRFTQHYTGAPVCAPARCVLMTGSTGDPNRKGFDLFFGYNCQSDPGPWEVYDLAQDRAEANDLAASRPDLIRQAEAILRREVSGNARFPVPIPGVNGRELLAQEVETLSRPLHS